MIAERHKTELKKVPLFSDLDAEELPAIVSISKIRPYPKDNILFLQGDPGDAFYLILEGSVKVTLLGSDGREYILAILKSGEYFGEMGLFDQQTRSASVVTIENSTFLVIRRAGFLEQINKAPRILSKFLMTLSRRLRKTDEQLGDLALLNVHARVSKVLLALADSQSTSDDNKETVIEKCPTHQDIASMVGATRETVTRILNELKKNDDILISGRKITIKRRAGSE